MMLEIIAFLLVTLVAGAALLILTSIFIAYASQANYVDENDDGAEDD